MARYLRDPSRDHPLPRSFRHRGLHHGSGSTQNQAGPGPQIRRARIHGYVQLTALPRTPPSGPISFRTQKYKWKGWTQGEGAEGQWGWPFQCSSVHGVREGLCVITSVSQPESNRYWVLARCMDNPHCSHKSPRSSAAHFIDKGASKERGGEGGPC